MGVGCAAPHWICQNGPSTMQLCLALVSPVALRAGRRNDQPMSPACEKRENTNMYTKLRYAVPRETHIRFLSSLRSDPLIDVAEPPGISYVRPVLPSPQCKQRPDIRDILQPFQQGHQVQEIVIRRVADPALYGNGVVCVDPPSSAFVSCPGSSRGEPYLGGTCS